MLRKTGHQRNSMKRTPIYDSYDGSSRNEVYRSDMGRNRAQSPEWSPNDMVRMSEKYGRDDAWGGSKRNGNESVTAELAPGIVVEGYVADL